jgi:hypothetical protein
MNRIRNGKKLPKENTALNRKDAANNQRVPDVGKSPINDFPNRPNSLLELLTNLFL